MTEHQIHLGVNISNPPIDSSWEAQKCAAGFPWCHCCPVFPCQMLLEFCDGGAVDSIMVELDRGLKEPQIAYITRGMVEGLQYLHQHKVVHRDIKAGNVLLTMDGGVKLSEWGRTVGADRRRPPPPRRPGAVIPDKPLR